VATSAAQIAKTGKFGDLRRRLVFLLLALVVYRVGAHIPVPGIDPTQLQQLFKGQQGGILSLFNMFSGGALSRFTVFALGIMPYISASIIMQLLTYVLPTFEQLKKEGESGRRKITQYTRYGTLGLAIFQSLGYCRCAGKLCGLGAEPGLRLSHDRRGQPDRGDDVPDVAG
jgi:preprotein translocase subunit SecY